jgi:hypothetical protein
MCVAGVEGWLELALLVGQLLDLGIRSYNRRTCAVRVEGRLELALLVGQLSNRGIKLCELQDLRWPSEGDAISLCTGATGLSPDLLDLEVEWSALECEISEVHSTLECEISEFARQVVGRTRSTHRHKPGLPQAMLSLVVDKHRAHHALVG